MLFWEMKLKNLQYEINKEIFLIHCNFSFLSHTLRLSLYKIILLLLAVFITFENTLWHDFEKTFDMKYLCSFLHDGRIPSNRTLFSKHQIRKSV